MLLSSLHERRAGWQLLSLLLLLAASPCVARVDAQRALPAPDRVVRDYLKAVGGQKRAAAIKDATYDYEVLLNGQRAGRAQVRLKASSFARVDERLDAGSSSSSGSNGRSAWVLGPSGQLRTMTDASGNSAKLEATLTASRFADYRKLDVLARTAGIETLSGEPAYVLEFSSRNGARVRCWFGVSSRLLLKLSNEAQRLETFYGDYRAEQGLLEPHRIEMQRKGSEPHMLVLQTVSYNTGLAASIFDPPVASSEALDIPALLRELQLNQRKINERVAEYSFVEKRIERELNNRGEVTSEKVSVYEVYPLIDSRPVRKLISENGVPLSPERAAKRDKEIAEFLARYEQEREKKARKLEAEKQKGETAAGKKEDDDDDVGIEVFLRASEFVSPRREQRGEREAVVFDFRPRAGFRPKTRAEAIASKLAGIAWIDPADKVVMRLEARLAEGYKVGGGLVANISQGSAVAFEQARVADGVWLPRSAQLNLKARVMLFKGVEANETREYSDYKRFSGEATDYRLNAPASAPARAPNNAPASPSKP